MLELESARVAGKANKVAPIVIESKEEEPKEFKKIDKNKNKSENPKFLASTKILPQTSIVGSSGNMISVKKKTKKFVVVKKASL